MRDVSEWTGMNEHGGSLERLQQVRSDGVFHKNCKRSARSLQKQKQILITPLGSCRCILLVGGYQVVCGDRLSTFAARNNNLSQSIAHVCQACRQSQDGHDFTGNRDIKLAL